MPTATISVWTVFGRRANALEIRSHSCQMTLEAVGTDGFGRSSRTSAMSTWLTLRTRTSAPSGPFRHHHDA